MSITFLSEHLAIVAVVAGIISAATNTAIEALLNASIDKKHLKIKETLAKSAIMSCTVGFLLGVIYYAFALYGFPEKSMTPIQLILLFAVFFGLGNPLIGAAIKLFQSQLTKNV